MTCSAQVHIFCSLSSFQLFNSFLGLQGTSFLLLGFMCFGFVFNLLHKPWEMPKHLESLGTASLGSVRFHRFLRSKASGMGI